MQAVIFDLGGVLIDYDHAVTFACLAELAGVSVERMWQLWADIDEPFGKGEMNGRDFYHYMQQQTNLTAEYETLAQAFCCSQERNKSALAFVTELTTRPSTKVGIISNTNEIHANWLRQNVPEFYMLDTITMSHEVGFLKPRAEIYNLTLHQMQISTEQAIFIDDALPNVQGATAVGMAAIHHQDWEDTKNELTIWLTQTS